MAKAGKIAASRKALARANATHPVERYHARMARLQAAAKRASEDPRARWCILRTAANRTLPLMRSLNKAGFDVWTPAELRERRIGRNRERVEVEAALMPSFVFARADTQDMVNDLFRAQSLPGTEHPAFSIFRRAGRVPTIAERAMAALRSAEETKARAMLKKERRSLSPGQSVRVSEPAFTGLLAVVKQCDGRTAEIEIAGFTMKVATWLLVPDAVSGSSSPEGTAAKAA